MKRPECEIPWYIGGTRLTVREGGKWGGIQYGPSVWGFETLNLGQYMVNRYNRQKVYRVGYRHTVIIVGVNACSMPILYAAHFLSIASIGHILSKGVKPVQYSQDSCRDPATIISYTGQ